MIEMTCPVCKCEFYTPDADELQEVQGLKVQCADCNTKSKLIGSRLIPFATIENKGQKVTIRFVRFAR